MTATMTFCVISICCAAAQFAIGIAAAVNDHSRSDTGELSRERHYLRNDIYYERNDPFLYLYPHYCTDSGGAFTWVSLSLCQSVDLRHYCQQLTLSVRPSVSLSNFKLLILFLFLDGIKPFFGRQLSINPLYKTLFLDF